MRRKAQHNAEYQPVPDLLRAMRDEAGLTQRDMAKALKKPQSWVHNCETTSRRVDVAEFAAWCRACGVRPETGFKSYLRAVGQ